MPCNILKILGSTADSLLDFSNHVKSICKLMTVKLKALYNNWNTTFPESSKLEVVCSRILPVMHNDIPSFFLSDSGKFDDPYPAAKQSAEICL